MDIIIFIEHRARELENACLLKYELTRRGYSVRLSQVEFWNAFWTFFHCKPKVIVVPWLYDDDDVNFFHSFRRCTPNNIVNLQSEQITSQSIRDSKRAYPRNTAKDANHICWGIRIRDYLLDEGLKSENLQVLGAISTDFSRAEFSDYYKSKKELAECYNLDSSKKWILFISSFSYTTMSEDQKENIGGRFGDDFFNTFYNFSVNSKVSIIEWIRKYLIIHANDCVIYRPHPSEYFDMDLRHLENEYPNFKVISVCSVRQWIKVCDKINNWFSTSFTDVYFEKKSCSILRPYSILEEYDNEQMVGANFITTFEGFEEYNQSDISDLFPAENSAIEDFYLVDEIPVYVKLANFIEKVYNDSKAIGVPNIIEKKQIEPRRWCKFAIKNLVILVSSVVPIIKFLPKSIKTWAETAEKECPGIYYDIWTTEKKIKQILNKKIE